LVSGFGTDSGVVDDDGSWLGSAYLLFSDETKNGEEIVMACGTD